MRACPRVQVTIASEWLKKSGASFAEQSSNGKPKQTQIILETQLKITLSYREEYNGKILLFKVRRSSHAFLGRRVKRFFRTQKLTWNPAASCERAAIERENGLNSEW